MDGSSFIPVQQDPAPASPRPLQPAAVEWVAVRSGDSALIIPFPAHKADE